MQKSVSLRYTQGSSDKVYNAELVPDGGLWVVNFSYGKYGSSLRAGTKTKTGIPYERALKIYNKIVDEKLSKGYSPEGDGAAFSGTANAGRVTGYLPQRLTPVTEDEILALIASEPGCWVGEEKHDGERRGFKVEGGSIVSANLKGLSIPTNKLYEEAALKLAEHGVTSFEIDCEDMGSYLVVFDILMFEEEDLRALPLSYRLDKRNQFTAACVRAGIDAVIRTTSSSTDLTPSKAKDLIEEHREAKSEGVVFKHTGSSYVPGRPASGGPHRKLKFTYDATVRIKGHNEGKRSVSMEVLDGDSWVDVGNVTIPSNAGIPDVGAFVDVNYLYAYPKGSLFQPVFKGLRTDVDAKDCDISKLVYKREEAA